MSGIVRGFVKRHRFQQDHKFAVLPDPPVDCADIPVAVVPLDDTTLAGMVEKFRDAYADLETVRSVIDFTHYDGLMAGLRAALGLEGGA